MEKTDDCEIYLSAASLDCEILTSRADVLVKAAIGEGDVVRGLLMHLQVERKLSEIVRSKLAKSGSGEHAKWQRRAREVDP